MNYSEAIQFLYGLRLFGAKFGLENTFQLAAQEKRFAERAGRVIVCTGMKTVEAIIEPNGEVHLVEPVHVESPRRALVTILEEASTVHDAALLSEAALAEDWDRAEEDAAWAHLQPAKSS